MDIDNIRSKVEDHFFNQGKNIMPSFLMELDHKLYRLCESKSQKSGLHRNAELHKILYGYVPCHCGAPKKYKNFRDGFTLYCSSKCAGADPAVDAKRTATNLEKFGTARPQQNLPEIRQKFTDTMIERYGVAYGGQSDELNAKRAATCLKLYGTTHAQSSQQVKDKTRKTNLERYGVEHISHDREWLNTKRKRGYELRECVVAGKEFRVQGYEEAALRWLVDCMKCNVDKIDNVNVPSVPWHSKGKSHVYHPDFRAKIKNKWYIVEVKSTFTLGVLSHIKDGKSGLYSRVRKKAQACIDAGHRYMMLVVAKYANGDYYVAPIENLHLKTKAQVRQELKSLHPHKFRQL